MSYSYTTLVAAKSTAGSIAQWLNKDNLPVTSILEEAEQYLYRRLRLKEMLAVATGSISASANPATGPSTLAHPTGYIASQSFRLVGTTTITLTRKSLKEIEEGYTFTSTGSYNRSTPLAYCSVAATFQFDTAADAAYSYRLAYYRQLDALSSVNTTNVLTDRGQRALRAACMAFGNEWLKDSEEKNYWLQVCDVEMARLNAEDDFEQTGVNFYPVVP